MINKISINIADYFFEKKLIEKNDKDLYVYGLHIIISSFIGIVEAIKINSIDYYYNIAVTVSSVTVLMILNKKEEKIKWKI